MARPPSSRRACVWPRKWNSPDTRVDAFLTLTSSVPHAPPDESLHSVPGLATDDVLATPDLPPAWSWYLSRGNFTTRLNPPGVFDAIDDAQPMIWRDPAHDRVGITGREVSFAFLRNDVNRLEIKDEPPDRSPWCARGIEVLIRRKDGATSRVALGDAGCHMNDWAQADPSQLLARLAGFWNVPLATAI